MKKKMVLVRLGSQMGCWMRELLPACLLVAWKIQWTTHVNILVKFLAKKILVKLL